MVAETVHMTAYIARPKREQETAGGHFPVQPGKNGFGIRQNRDPGQALADHQVGDQFATQTGNRATVSALARASANWGAKVTVRE